AGTLPLAFLSTDTTFTYVATANAVRMFGVAMVMMPVTTAALNQLPRHLVPHGAALNNTMRQVAASVGAALLITVMVSTALDPAEHGMQRVIHGANMAFLVSVVVAALGVIGSFFIRDSHGEDVDAPAEVYAGAGLPTGGRRPRTRPCRLG